jgi:nucleotide-binding universal stress UspA family protein
MARFSKILVPVDFSDHSGAALQVAVDLAKVCDAKILLLHCYQIQTGGISPYGIVLPSDYYEEIRDAASKQLAQWKEKVIPEGIEVESVLSSDSPWERISATAEEIGADLIVMGTRGLAGIKHAMLGSVAERTLRAAPCPVVTVKASAPGGAGDE